MKYFLYSYDDVFIGKVIAVDSVEPPYKNAKLHEVTEEMYKKIVTPCKFINNKYVSCKMPEIDTGEKSRYVSESNSALEFQDTETDIMEMSIDHEYRLTLLELGITEE